MYQPPLLPDDTQPRPPRWDDTQPNPLEIRRRWWQKRGRWILGTVILSTSFTLLITLAILLRPSPPQTVTNIAYKTITLELGDNVRTIKTDANTIADVLSEQNIVLSPDDAVSSNPTDKILDGMTISINRAREVTLTVNGERQLLNTAFENPLDILQSVGITTSASDLIWLDGTPATLETLPIWTVPVTSIEIRQAVTLTILDEGVESTISTTADTVGTALFDAGITLYLTDKVSPPSDRIISGDLQITIDRAIPIQFIVDGVTVDARTNANTINDILTEMNAPLFGLDYVRPAGDTQILEGMTIEIVRVTEEVITSSETIPFEVTYQADADMNLDNKATIQAGQDGTKETRTRIRYENGIEVSRTAEGATITQAPVNQIVAYGTNIVLNTIDTPEGPREYWRTFRVYATSYHPEALGGDNVTATGATLKKGVIGADPRIIPWRTEMFVPGYGTGKMADTGGARSSHYWIDLGYSDDDWVAWHDYVDVYLLAPIPDKINHLLPKWTALR